MICLYHNGSLKHVEWPKSKQDAVREEIRAELKLEGKSAEEIE